MQCKNILILGLVFVSLGFSACNKKVCQMGNGGDFDVEFYYPNDVPVPIAVMKEVKYFYITSSGSIDTLKPIANTNDIVASNVAIYIEGEIGYGFLRIGNLLENTLSNRIKDGNLYLQFPDGHIDTLRVNVRNDASCRVERLNYWVDGMKYNSQDAAFVWNPGIEKIGYTRYRFKVYLN